MGRENNEHFKRHILLQSEGALLGVGGGVQY